MRPRERDLLISIGHYGPPPEPLWMPWHCWSIPIEWQWALPSVRFLEV